MYELHMKRLKERPTLLNNDPAVSEVVGVILLLSIGIIGFGIIAAFLLPDTNPDELPMVQILAYNNSSPYIDPSLKYPLILVHDGGDTLYSGNIKILVNGTDVTSSALNSSNKKWINQQWKVGERLLIPKANATTVDLVFFKGRVETVITHISDVTEISNP